jgi:hypothetical protein
MTRDMNPDEKALEAQTRSVRYFALVLAVAGFAAALLIASQSAG